MPLQEISSNTFHTIEPGSHKRTYSEIDETEDTTANKHVKLDPAARVQDLEAQIYELHEFIQKFQSKDLASEAPPSIRERLEAHDGAAQKLSDSIRRRIDEVYEPLWEDSYNGRKTGISSVDVTDAMVDFVPETRRLTNINGSLNLAFDLMMHLASHYYGELDGGGDGGDQLCDGPADDLLVQILQRMEEDVFCFKPEKELATLKAHAKELDDYGLESFFAKSIHDMSTWLEALESAKVFWQQQQY